MIDPRIAVILEAGRQRVFASAADWPGWARGAKTADGALAALARYAERYAPIADVAGHPLPADAAGRLEVAERVDGNATTDFGAPGVVAVLDGRPTSSAEAARLTALVDAAWATLERVAADAPEELTKGPRGGGRDTSKMVGHVSDAEVAYAAALGLGARDVAAAAVDGDRPAAVRALIGEAIARPSDGAPIHRWRARYAARRIAWHVLDHAWEIEDRTPR